jgi:hypothetical protein
MAGRSRRANGATRELPRAIPEEQIRADIRAQEAAQQEVYVAQVECLKAKLARIQFDRKLLDAYAEILTQQQAGSDARGAEGSS